MNILSEIFFRIHWCLEGVRSLWRFNQMYSNYLKCSVLIHLLQTCVIFLFPLYVLISPSHLHTAWWLSQWREFTSGFSIVASVCKYLVSQLCLTLGSPMDCSPPGFSLSCLGFSRQEYWSGVPFPPSGALPDPEI